MKRALLILFIILLLSLLLGVVSTNVLSQEKSGKIDRETVLQRKVHIEKDLILDVPQVPMWCDRLELKKYRVSVGDCELYVEEEGKGIPVVLLHGGPGSTHHYFHPHFSKAKDFSRIIYYDQRGCGLSDYEKGGGYTINQAVDDLENLRKALEIDKWVLLGHSYGGVLGQCYTVKYPESVAGLLLVDSGMAMPAQLNPSRQHDYMAEEEKERLRQIRTDLLRLFQERKISMKQKMEVLLFNNFINGDWKRQNFYRPSREKIAQIALYEWKHDTNFNEIISKDMKRVNLKGAFNNCPIPRLIIEGKWDLTWNTDKPQKLHRNHPGSRMEMFEHSGHGPFEDEPGKFFREMREFVKNLPEVPNSDISRWKEYLAAWKKTKEDPFLSQEMSRKEAVTVEKFNIVRKKIWAGEKFEDVSTPLRTLLTILSSVHHRDREMLDRNLALDLGKMGVELTEDYMKGMEEFLSEVDILRTPSPPRHPEQGEFWPIYVKESSGTRHKDTLLVVFWKGRWMWFGNLGGPGDWRSVLPSLKALLEQSGKK